MFELETLQTKAEIVTHLPKNAIIFKPEFAFS